MEAQPARLNYFFSEGYYDYGQTFKATFDRCGDVISDSWDSVCDNAEEMWDNLMDVIGLDEAFTGFFKAIGYAFLLGMSVGRLIFSAVFTPILCFIMSALQGVFLILVMMGVYMMYIAVAFADWLYRRIKKISTSCPQCQNKYSLPVYICECGAKHTRLVPSRYGVFNRRCTCNRKLKTTFFNGRHKQPGKWVCPNCGYELGGPLQVDIPIPVVGGPGSGKTCYISMAITEIERAANSYGLDFQYRTNAKLGDDYAINKRNMSRGKLPEKTNDMRLRYYQFYLTPKGEKVKNLISLCDVAGETYDSNDEMGKQIGYKYANAFLMIVDPLSVARFREEMEGKINLVEYGASARGMDEVLNTLISTLENMKCLTSKNMIKTDVAVVFSKCDIPGIDDKIGDGAVKSYMSMHRDVKDRFEAQNILCEQFLRDYEEENFLNSLKAKFKSIQFFTCSALGHVENGSVFTPDGVADPALWLIDKASASINLNKKWGKKI